MQKNTIIPSTQAKIQAMIECESKQEEIAVTTEKPIYISELEKEILALTPDEVVKVAALVAALKSERTPEL